MVRFKNRYFVIKIAPSDKLDKALTLKTTVLLQSIQQKVQQLFGDYGLAAIQSGFNAKYCNVRTKIAIVRTRHGPHKFLLKSLPLISNIGERLVNVEILYVGATMKHCFIFIRKYQLKKLEQMWRSLRTEAERNEMREALMTFTPAMKEFV